MTAFDETNQVVARDGRKAWDEFGREFLADICARCGYGRTFGWKVIVLKANTRSDAVSDKPSAKVRAIHKEAKKIEISMQPAKCNYRFEVELCTQRCDQPFWDVAQKVKSMIEYVCPEAAEPAKVSGLAAAAATNGDGHDAVNVIDLAKLSKLGGKIEKALQVGKDINEMATLKIAANQKLTNAKDHEEVKRREYEAAKTAYEERQRLYVAKKELVDDLDRRLKAAVRERDDTQAATTDLLAKLETKRLELKPWSETVAEAERELADLAAIEAEQAKQIGSVDGLRALIAALSNLPG